MLMTATNAQAKKRMEPLATAPQQAGKMQLQQAGRQAPQGPATFSGVGQPAGAVPKAPAAGAAGMSPMQALAKKYAAPAPAAVPGGAARPGQPAVGQTGLHATPTPGAAPPGVTPPAPVGAAPAPVTPAPQPQMANAAPQASMPTPQDVWNKLKGIPQAAGQGAQDVANNVAGAVQGAMPNVPGFDLNSFNPLKLLQQWGFIPGSIDVSGGMFGGGAGFGGGGGGGAPPTKGPNGGNNPAHVIPTDTPGSGHGPGYVRDMAPAKWTPYNNNMGSYGTQANPTGPMETAAGSPIPTLANQTRDPLNMAVLGPNKNLSEGGAGTVGGNAQGQTAGPSEDDLAKLLARFQGGDTVTPTGAHGNVQARDASVGPGADAMPDTVYPNAEGGPLGAMADWMTSGDINRLKKNVGSFNDLNSEANNELRASIGDFNQAGVTGNYSRDAARQMTQQGIDRERAAAMRDFNSREARGGLTGTGATQGIHTAAMNAGKDAELQLQNRAFQEEMGRLGQLNNARGNLAESLGAGSRIDMENILNNYTSNKELMGQLLGFIPELIGNVVPF